MNSKEPQPDSLEPTPDAEELLRATSPTRGSESPACDGYRALGEVLDAATCDFDWTKLAARLEMEFSSPPRPREVQELAPPRRYSVWISLTTAALLLISFGGSLLSPPANKSIDLVQRVERSTSKPIASAPAIDSWDRPAALSEVWNDEIDAELAATQRELRQGRDPWASDEPALSQVFAQIGDLTAGLVFEPF